jgi:Na+/phosphate symporter
MPFDKDEMIRKTREQLESMSDELDKAGDKLNDYSADLKKVYSEQKAELENLLNEAKQKVDKAKSSSTETWKEIEDYVQVTAKALKQSINYFKSQMKQKK